MPRQATIKPSEDFPKENNKKRILNLDPWQREVLEYKGNIIVCSGRQTGKSTIIAIKAA